MTSINKFKQNMDNIFTDILAVRNIRDDSNKKKFLQKRELLYNHLPSLDVINIIDKLLDDMPPLLKGFSKHSNPYIILKYYEYCGNYIDRYFNRYFKGYNRTKPPLRENNKREKCDCKTAINNVYLITDARDKNKGDILKIGSTCIKDFWGSKVKKCKGCPAYITFKTDKKNKEKKRCRKCEKKFKEKKELKKIKQMKEQREKEEKQRMEEMEIWKKTHCKDCEKKISEKQAKYGNRCYNCNNKSDLLKYSCSVCKKKMRKDYLTCYNCNLIVKQI